MLLIFSGHSTSFIIHQNKPDVPESFATHVLKKVSTKTSQRTYKNKFVKLRPCLVLTMNELKDKDSQI